MEMEKPRREIEDDHDNDEGIGRSYECSYCKRGFTNAQALGGHMNIHRKDKAKAKSKAKQCPTSTFSSSISFNNDRIDNHQASTYSPAFNFSPLRNYQTYNYHDSYNYDYNYDYPSADNNPRSFSSSSSQPSIYFGNENFPVGRSGLFGMYDEARAASLSLRKTGEYEESYKKKDENSYDAIDLELRLGYDP